MSSKEPMGHSESYVHLAHEETSSGSAGVASYPESHEEVEYVEEVVYEEVNEEEEEEQEQEAEQLEQQGAAAANSATAAPEHPATDSEQAKVEAAAEPLPTSSDPVAAAAFEKLAVESDATTGSTAPASTLHATEASATQGSVGVDLDLKQLEAQAAKVAKEVQEAAKAATSKLTAGLKSALTGMPEGGLSKLAGGLSSWWSSLDPAPQPQRNETAEHIAASNRASSELQQLFGLNAEENLVEQFKCKLLQTYACNHNSFTPAIQMAFQGTLYITDQHTCFSVEERGRKLPFKVQHSQVVKSTRQRPVRKGDMSDILKLELSNGQFFAFKDFDSGSALDSALALVEHLTEAS